MVAFPPYRASDFSGARPRLASQECQYLFLALCEYLHCPFSHLFVVIIFSVNVLVGAGILHAVDHSQLLATVFQVVFFHDAIEPLDKLASISLVRGQPLGRALR